MFLTKVSAFLKEGICVIKEKFWWSIEEFFDTETNRMKTIGSSILILTCLVCVFLLTFWWPLILRKTVFWAVFPLGCFILLFNLFCSVFSLIFFVIVKPYRCERIKKWCWGKAWNSRHQSEPIR